MSTQAGTIRVGLIGCGAIGSVVADALDAGRVGGARLEAVLVRSKRSEGFAEGVAADGIDELLDRCDLVVEAAGQAALAAHGPAILERGIDLVAVSVGAMADPETFAALTAAGPGTLILPTGAVGGIDMVRSAAELGPIEQATITSTKLPKALVQDWMTDDEAAAVLALEGPETLFDGDVRELVRRFPSSTNVAATLALAVGSWERVRGVVRADPAAALTSHVIEVSAAAGDYRFEMRNRPSPSNPRSSAVVAWSVVRTLRDRCEGGWRIS